MIEINVTMLLKLPLPEAWRLRTWFADSSGSVHCLQRRQLAEFRCLFGETVNVAIPGDIAVRAPNPLEMHPPADAGQSWQGCPDLVAQRCRLLRSSATERRQGWLWVGTTDDDR